MILITGNTGSCSGECAAGGDGWYDAIDECGGTSCCCGSRSFYHVVVVVVVVVRFYGMMFIIIVHPPIITSTTNIYIYNTREVILESEYHRRSNHCDKEDLLCVAAASQPCLIFNQKRGNHSEIL